MREILLRGMIIVARMQADFQEPSMGHASLAHYRGLIDLMMSYGGCTKIKGTLMSFQDIYQYSGWIMVNSTTRGLHLSKQVLR